MTTETITIIPIWKETIYSKMKPIVDKLIIYLLTKGIETQLIDDETDKTVYTSDKYSKTERKIHKLEHNLDNVIFKKDGKVLKISHKSLYRYSGISSIHKDKGANEVEIINVSDEMYINNYIKIIIESYFK